MATLAGCASPHDGVVRSVASRFASAVEAGDGRSACELLAPVTRHELEQSAGTPCATAVLEEDLPPAGPVEDSAVFGTTAQVRLTDDTVFVTQFPDGWKVLAAGCAPVPGAPYDCRLQGG
jgi:hypothetical protein